MEILIYEIDWGLLKGKHGQEELMKLLCSAHTGTSEHLTGSF
jgi:hypothetical protein